MADQFTYEVDIPGQGKFHVNSASELTDAQAYEYASAQATHETKSAAPSVGVGEDMGRAALSGAPRAITGLATLPRTLSDLRKALDEKMQASGMPDSVKFASQFASDTYGLTPGAMIAAHMPSAQDARGFLASIPGLGWTNYTPQTGPGRYTQAGVEGATAGAPFGVPGAVSGALSGVGGEAGYDLTGSQWGRLAGSLGAGLTPTLWQTIFGNRAAQLAQQATRNTTPQEWDAAMAKQATANQQGAPLTGAEALENPQLLALQRTTETAPASTNFMQRWMRARGAQTQAAIGSEVDSMGPPLKAEPSATAAATQQSASDALNQARRGVNASAAPLYGAADAARVPSNTWNSLISDPPFQRALQVVKRDPMLGLENETEGSMRWIDAAKKYLDSAAEPSMAASALERTASRSASMATNRVLPVVDAQVPAYGQARATVERGMADTVEPLEAGPLGKLAKAGSVKQQFGALTDPAQDVTPVLASEAARRLKMNNPANYRDLIRSGMEQQLDLAATVRTNDATRVGERFYKSMFETPQTADNVRALLRELPEGNVRVLAFDNLMETLRLQSGRLSVGSPTVEKGAQLAETLPNGAMKLVREPLKATSEWVGRIFGGDANTDLARIFTGQESVKDLRQLAVVKPGSSKAGALAASLLGASDPQK